jgi:hypothetical protein
LGSNLISIFIAQEPIDQNRGLAIRCCVLPSLT